MDFNKFRIKDKVTPAAVSNGVDYSPNKVKDGEIVKNESSDVLAALDGEKFSWYHVKAILVSGVG